MRVLLHKELELRRVRGSFRKIRAAIEADDFRTADVRKLHAGPYYLAKLDVLAALPDWLWTEKRRKRGYVNQVLTRAVAGSPYRPSRQFWVRSRPGHYLPNPAMKLRHDDTWRPVYKGMNLAGIAEGCGREKDYWTKPATMIARFGRKSPPEEREAPPAEHVQA